MFIIEFIGVTKLIVEFVKPTISRYIRGIVYTELFLYSYQPVN